MTTTLFPAFQVLLVDDEPAWLRSLGMTLEGRAGITNLRTCSDSRQVPELLANEPIGLVLLDLNMPHLSGEQLLELIAEQYPQVLVIIISGLNQVEVAVRCVQRGAFDYFVKTVEEQRLIDGVLRAIRMAELQRENSAMRRSLLRDRLESPEAFADIVTASPLMQGIFQYVEAVAGSRQPMLITGESGTGKELVARALHQLSGRSGQLVAVNVAGLDDTHFSDTLFGHLRGAFTGADAARKGMIEQAAEGTLFLDEIGDLSFASQVKLLRLLQEGEYYPLGSDQPKQMSARVVVATHCNLEERLAAGQFRRDLYYRLLAHHVHLPPLRERKEDLPLLLEHFLSTAAQQLGKATPTPPRELVPLLATYHFPGNIRELEAMVFDAVSQHGSRTLSMKSFTERIGAGEGTLAGQAALDGNPFSGCDPLPTLQQSAQLLIEEALQRAGGNQSLAARLLGISQPALSKRLRQERGN